ncbi:MAG TPA: histidine kinase [Thiothrix sp.]|nr:histidine kinase [Thiothrix sp.]
MPQTTAQNPKSNVSTRLGSADVPLVELKYLATEEKDTNTTDNTDVFDMKDVPAIIFPWQAQVGFVVLFLLFIMIGTFDFWIINSHIQEGWLPFTMSILWGVAGIGLLVLLWWIWDEFTQFGNDLSQWAESLRLGELSERMSIPHEFSPSYRIRRRLNRISCDYQKLSEKIEQRHFRQERHIEQKKHYLTVLYDVAACINGSNDLEDLLNQFLMTLKEVVKAEAATVRLLDDDGQMRLVASIGLTDDIIKKEEIMPAPHCLCGKAAVSGEIKIRQDLDKCNLRVGSHFFKDENVELIAVPLQYRSQTLGVYNLFINKKHHALIEDESELLISIGRHLGMAIEKASLDEEAKLLSIMEERTRMAHELHDSLAQTLASLRYKARLLDDSLHTDRDELIWSGLEDLEASIDIANIELRSLMTDFRAPIDERGIVCAIERLSKRFERETGLEVFFYQNWHLERLPRKLEVEVVRIVQEALVNIRKHSQAKTIRILIYSSAQGECRILVEDDGIGMQKSSINKTNDAGEHIGLTVMRERAARINGEIQFDSEEGEGTLIQLNFTVS